MDDHPTPQHRHGPGLDSDPDPIVASIPVFLNPRLPGAQRLIILQHASKTEAQAALSPYAPATELRVKPRGGFVELDVPLNTTVAYDKDKGLRWGKTLASSNATKSGGSHGLPGGFGVGVAHRGKKRDGTAGGVGGGASEPGDEEGLMDWNDAVRQDKVLRTQTLGGQYPEMDEVNHMVGVFSDGNLHLTPISALVNLRPQLHHVDAQSLTEQASRISQPSAKDAASSSTSLPGSANASAARAIHMTIKTVSGADGDTVTTETMADRLRSVQLEQWNRFGVLGEDADETWWAFTDGLLLRAAQSADAPGPDATVAGEGNDNNDDENTRMDGVDGNGSGKALPLASKVPHLGVAWNDNQMLEAVSGIKKTVMVDDEDSETDQPTEGKGKEVARGPATAPRRALKSSSTGEAVSGLAGEGEIKKGRPRGRPATRGRGGGRGRGAGGTSRGSSSMTIDLT